MAGLDTVEVCIDLERFGHPVPMGQLHRQESGSGETRASMNAFRQRLARVLGLFSLEDSPKGPTFRIFRTQEMSCNV